MTVFILIFTIGLSSNPLFKQLLENIRYGHANNADSLWELYIKNLKKENEFTTHPEQIGAPENIRDYEIKLVNGEITEAEFSYFIGSEFARNGQSMESEWYLNKSESLGFICAETYLMHAANYAQEWNNYLHYNEDLSNPNLAFYEEKWRESLKKFIASSKDSLAIDNARLQLTCIYSPYRTPIFIDEFAPIAIGNLEEFIEKYPKSKVINAAYERLVWWLSVTKKFEKLKNTCLDFLKNYPKSAIKEYIKFQLGNSYLGLHDTSHAKQLFKSIKTDSLPASVYPGWGKLYIFKLLINQLIELEN